MHRAPSEGHSLHLPSPFMLYDSEVKKTKMTLNARQTKQKYSFIPPVQLRQTVAPFTSTSSCPTKHAEKVKETNHPRTRKITICASTFIMRGSKVVRYFFVSNDQGHTGPNTQRCKAKLLQKTKKRASALDLTPSNIERAVARNEPFNHEMAMSALS